MSIPKLRLVPQAPAETVTQEPVTLDFTDAVTVSRQQLVEAYQDTRHVSRCLHNIENLSDLGYSELAYLCRTLYHATQVLGEILAAKGEAR